MLLCECYFVDEVVQVITVQCYTESVTLCYDVLLRTARLLYTMDFSIPQMKKYTTGPQCTHK